MKKYLSLLLGLLLLSFFQVNRVQANNIRIVKLPELTLLGDSVEIAFSLSWDNSWRDEYNWDAAWVFVKYKKEGATTAWSHVNLGRVTSLPSDLSSDFGLTGSSPIGVFIYRNVPGEGNLVDKEVKLKVAKAQLGNPTAEEIAAQRIHVAVSGIEMVFVPYGAYYLGDGTSKNSFRSVQQRIIPASKDIIDLHSGYQYSCIPAPHYPPSPPKAAADRINNAAWSPPYTHVFHISADQHGAGSTKNNSWIVKFDSPKTIRSFGVSGVTGNEADCPPYVTVTVVSPAWVSRSGLNVTPSSVMGTVFDVSSSFSYRHLFLNNDLIGCYFPINLK